MVVYMLFNIMKHPSVENNMQMMIGWWLDDVWMNVLTRRIDRRRCHLLHAGLWIRGRNIARSSSSPPPSSSNNGSKNGRREYPVSDELILVIYGGLVVGKMDEMYLLLCNDWVNTLWDPFDKRWLLDHVSHSFNLLLTDQQYMPGKTRTFFRLYFFWP